MTAVIPDQRTEPDPAESWQLVQGAQAGDTAAFADLYRRYHDTVLRFIYFRVGGNRPLAEDLAGDVWVRALRNIGRIEWQGRDIGAWLVTIARNRVADHFKSGRYRLEVTTGDVLDQDRVEENPTGELERAELRSLLDEAIGMLTPEQADVIRLRYLEGLSEAETAARLGVDVHAMKARAYRGRQGILRYCGDLLEAHR